MTTNKFLSFGVFFMVLLILILLCTGCRMTPEAWLKEWNAAWAECYHSLPPAEQTTTYFDPDADLMEQALFKPIVDRSSEVEELMKENYPDLYSYRGIPEYEYLLQEQTRKADEMLEHLRLLNEEQKERFLKQNQEWLRQFNKSILDSFK